ncbi:hypothetical protein OHS17_23135 [Streptomyces sp. NBC_00523]|uniref:hypothetical protein n=1 Tax=unclassified Streptomyces TaxID=2593676 RepID=UPI002E811751|nr:hypothetical protein [Streptomyces sp. NBC_00523]WUD02354.1 hypothetical protein OHS17_23135 [Streptomyces sp. NBC_00523]
MKASRKTLVAGAALAVALATPVAAEAAPAPVTSNLADLSATSLDQLSNISPTGVLARSLDRVSQDAVESGPIRPGFTNSIGE